MSKNSQNVLLDTQNAVLTKLRKVFVQAQCRKIIKKEKFSKRVISVNVFPGQKVSVFTIFCFSGSSAFSFCLASRLNFSQWACSSSCCFTAFSSKWRTPRVFKFFEKLCCFWFYPVAKICPVSQLALISLHFLAPDVHPILEPSVPLGHRYMSDSYGAR